jgi:hypothetical protein
MGLWYCTCLYGRLIEEEEKPKYREMDCGTALVYMEDL